MGVGQFRPTKKKDTTMATRSNIGILNTDGSITSIYCHWDGYPQHHMPLLEGHYNTEEKVRELLALGSISDLGPRLNPSPDSGHTFDHPEKGVTIAYHRDRGEQMWPAQTFQTLRRHRNPKAMEEFLYLFDPKAGTWACYTPIERRAPKSLTVHFT